MGLKQLGFCESQIIGDESDYYSGSKQNIQGVKEFVAVSKRIHSISSIEKKWNDNIQSNERIFCESVLPSDILIKLIKKHKEINSLKIIENIQSGKNDLSKIDKIVKKILIKKISDDEKSALLHNCNQLNDDHLLILSLIFRSPYEKLLFEVSKYLIEKKSFDLSIKYLKMIVQKVDCDWWAFYRSCYLLNKVYLKLKKPKKARRYGNLLKISCENFPL